MEDGAARPARRPPVLVLPLHGHLAPAAWAFARRGAGAARRLRADAGGALPGTMSRDVADAARAGAARGPRHRRALLRRRARGDQPRRGARTPPRRSRLGRGRRRSRSRDPRLGDALRPRRDGGARRRPRRAGARLPDARRAAPLGLRTRASATAASATTAPRCSSCCSRPVRVPVPEVDAGLWPAADGGGRRRGALRRAHSRPAATATTSRSRRWTSTATRRRPADLDDGPHARRRPAVLRRAACGRAAALAHAARTAGRRRRWPSWSGSTAGPCTPGGSSRFARRPIATPTARRRSARSSSTPALSRWSPMTRLTSGSCASRAKPSTEPALLEMPAGKLDVEGESPLEAMKRELVEEIGKEATRVAGAEGDLHEPGIRPRAGLDLPRDRLCGRSTMSGTRTSGSRSCQWPLDDLDGAIEECRDSKSLIGLLLFAELRDRRQL